MKITLKADHKSIKERIDFELPNFSVLTGKNGSGKTHLLEALANKDLTDVIVNGAKIKNARYIPFNGLNPNIQENCDPDTITKHIKNVWKEYERAKNQSTRRGQQNVNNETVLNQINNQHIRKHCAKALEETGKNYDVLTEDDLQDSFDIAFMGQNDFFTAQFALIFKNYHKLWLENQENKFYESQGIATTSSVLTDEEFLNKNGEPPWEFVNKILEETSIPYEVNSPMGSRKDTSFSFKLKDKVEGFEISSANLSTGEKVLMSLALAIYNTGGEQGKPELLLIDEPDAALHPSMTKKMVGVLKKNIVEENNIPTIITTHSPTTAVAAEGISIYQLERGNNNPKKIPTQKAVELLSGDIPFLKISTERRRQVFVESKYDVIYYELLTNIYGRIETFPSEPIYIPARTSNGSNCTDVIEVVNSLFSNGNDQIYGIIDWDLNNPSTNRIIVLGDGERYSIENYLLDPLLMGILMLRENKIPVTDFGAISVSNYPQFGQLTQGDAQVIITKVLTDLGLQSANTVTYKSFNGWELEVSEEFNKHQGHDLEQLYKSKYPFLNSYQREDALKKDVIEKVINDYPDFAPIALSKVIMKII
ncbi:putative ATPase [Catalinimonas alkaloidigena]|uniref:ATP-binding protein n=1 Tax=Catalinimonas alkaloidigena TaxID=1075417 RepID=UPI002406DCFF|nr:ATP-binding protein [Catalinimonas alkaloidigena]MDF9795364.1 putative ATPase [Catalinimonas alkaloidigena]